MKSTRNRKRISVCIAIYNGEKYIKEELLSILPQLSDDDEVIVSDDGSVDNTLEIIRSLDDIRITIIKNQHLKEGKKSHYYVSRNFENAIKHANGQYIFLADQDDVWMGNKVQVCLAELQNSDLVIHDLNYCDSELNPQNKVHYGDSFRFKNFFLLPGKYMGCCMAFKREVLDYVLPFPCNLLLHDQWIGFMTELVGHVRYINMPLINYRVHPNNTSSKSRNSLIIKISYRLSFIFHYCIRYLYYRLFHNCRSYI